MNPTRTLLPLLFPLAALACGPSVVAAPPTVPVATSDVSHAEVEPDRPTAAPAKPVPASLSALVATLVDTGEVTSAGVGYGGVKSASYAAYEELVAAATVQQLRDLLTHPSPSVRAYVAGHLAEHDPESLPLLGTSLDDSTAVEAQYGCMGARVTVADHVARQICYVRNYVPAHGPAAERLLRPVANDPSSPAHEDAKRCLADPAPTVTAGRP